MSLEIRPPDRAAVGFRRELSCSTLRKPPQNSMHVSWRHDRLLPSRWRAAPPPGVRRQRESIRTPASASAQAVRLSRLIRQLGQTARATTPRRKTRFHQSEYSSPRSELFLGGWPRRECEARAGKRRSARFDRRRAFSDRGQDERSYPVALDEFGRRRHSLGEPATSPWKGEWNYDVGRPLKGCPTRLNRFFRWNSGSRKFTSRF